MTRWIDASLPLHEDMAAWPGDPPFRRVTVAALADGKGFRVDAFSMSAHGGTHLDAPAHCLRDGATVDQAPPTLLAGPAWVADLPGLGRIDAEALAQAGVPERCERLLLRTDNTRQALLWGPFREDGVALTPDGAAWMVRAGVRLAGIDGWSIGGPDDGERTHRVLFEAGIFVLEGLDLREVPPGPVDLVALPLPIRGGEAAPCRVLVRPRARRPVPGTRPDFPTRPADRTR